QTDESASEHLRVAGNRFIQSGADKIRSAPKQQVISLSPFRVHSASSFFYRRYNAGVALRAGCQVGGVFAEPGHETLSGANRFCRRAKLFFLQPKLLEQIFARAGILAAIRIPPLTGAVERVPIIIH